MVTALRRNWREYLMEAALLGMFMVSACAFTLLLFHPGSPLPGAIPSGLLRRVLMGLAMGGTAVVLIYSPWGRRSGAHMNPAVTLSMARLGKMDPRDAFFYVLAQFAGGAMGVLLVSLAAGAMLSHPSVNFVATTPGMAGHAAAWAAEAAISFGMMAMVLAVNRLELARWTGWFAGVLVALYIAFEAPISGMSMNPARSFGSAAIGAVWTGFWIYLTAPVAGMLAATELHRVLNRPGPERICCKMNQCTETRCIFRCACKGGGGM